MTQAVMIKSKASGIHLVLNPALDYDTLKEEVIRKFQDSGRFFKDAKIGISFEGYELTHEQMYDLIDAIESQTSIRILCIMEAEKIQESCILERAEAFVQDKIKNHALLHKGTIHLGERVESPTSLVILGDVEQGAKVIANGNIIIYGTLEGFAHAGYQGDLDSYIAAVAIKTKQLQIGNILFIPKKQEEGGKNSGFLHRKKKKKEDEQLSPQIARVLDGHVIMEPYTKDLW